MTLEEFKDSWLKSWKISNSGLGIVEYDCGNVRSTVLYREGQFQVEMFIIHPNSDVPPHIHPNVDSFEIYLGGDISFMSDNQWYNQKVTSRVRQLKISSDTVHAAKIGEGGGVFLSIQLWKDMEPNRIGDNWSNISEEQNGDY